jgi:hypothetical protein
MVSSRGTQPLIYLAQSGQRKMSGAEVVNEALERLAQWVLCEIG